MKKSTSWAITLLLAAIVPFATGCDECKESRDQALLIDKLAFKMDSAVTKHDLSPESCRRDLLEVTNVLFSKREIAVKNYCDGELCESAHELSNGIRDLQQHIGDACRSVDSGGSRPGLVEDTNSPITLARLRDARKALVRINAPGTNIMIHACSPADLLINQADRDAALDSLRRQETANTTTTPVPSIYSGQAPANRPADVPPPAPPAHDEGTASGASATAPADQSSDWRI